MHAAPAFELHVAPGRGERTVLALIGSGCAAAAAAWLWSHVDAAAGPQGRGLASWWAVAIGGALAGGALGGWLAPRVPATLAWREGRWTLYRPGADTLEGGLRAMLDLGNWMLLRFEPAEAQPGCWLGVGQGQAGPAWHPLRATLFSSRGGEIPGGRDDDGVVR